MTAKWIVRIKVMKSVAVSQIFELQKCIAIFKITVYFHFTAPPIIIVSPPPTVITEISHTFVINCTALGIPTPEIVWRLNWGHVPEKCRMTSSPIEGSDGHAFGELTCPDAIDSDQGAYSCEAINSKGSCFAGN